MSTTEISKTALALLDAIERCELRSLAWGFVDGSLARAQVETLLANVHPPAIHSAGPDPLQELVGADLVFRVPNPANAERYRSRFAEMVRLLTRLRQIFLGSPWAGAPRLVSDFRVDVRPRRYPRRDRESESALESLAAEIPFSKVQRRVWETLLTRNGQKLNLAQFQVDATHRILSSPGDTGTIVTAGTGSGKTMAFYLPAFLRISDHVRVGEFWTKALALYPRNELLKDQLGETYRMARQLDSLMQKEGRRPIRLGALFSAVPRQSTVEELTKVGWLKRSNGFVCPFLRCPTCESEMIWLTKDLDAKKESLSCAKYGCQQVTHAESLSLTRHSLQEEAPDILFTTTEMLNQRISDTDRCRLFGIHQTQDRRPSLILLDEVHTYTGPSGAHVAGVLRRWRHALQAPVSFVGLSATLREAPQFFADLTGLAIERIAEVTPSREEMVYEGAEYQIILRGDPVSQTSTLSTSIQTGMLLGRMLDPMRAGRSRGNFGRRLFMFTDDLDVTNRLFDDLRDAEAYTIFGRPDPKRPPLASGRLSSTPADWNQDIDGQRWWASERLGHSLIQRLEVGRTTAKDTGVLAGANVIVATSALEVGFNDPEVGAVLQHKAPRNMASFLQRKGRAGRPRAMRPLMVTVLSDYGRDRIAFQTYEHLFDPELPPQRLPVRNQYVLRMQAVYALLDWMARKMSSTGKGGWLWEIASQPGRDDEDLNPSRIFIRDLLSKLLQGDETTRTELKQYLSGALNLKGEEVDVLLWQPPRSLLLEVIPTLTRRLSRNWDLAYPSGTAKKDLFVPYHPLPDFIPRNLFSELSLPEVRILLQPATVNHDPKEESLPLIQALLQLAPGRVTRRFAEERGGLAHWVPVDPSMPVNLLPISKFAQESEYIGDFTGLIDGRMTTLPVYRPWTVRLSVAKRSDALPTSNSSMRWCSYFQQNGQPMLIDVPPRTLWSEWIEGVQFFLHRRQASVSVRRFAYGASASVRRMEGSKYLDHPVEVRFTDHLSQPAALGFEMEVDAIVIDLRLPTLEALRDELLPEGVLAASRTAFYRHRVLSDDALPQDLNIFKRDWLQQIFISAVIARASRGGVSLAEAIAQVETGDVQIFQDVMRAVFSIQGVLSTITADDEDGELSEDDEESQASPAASGNPPGASQGTSPSPTSDRQRRLEHSLLDLLRQPRIVARLSTHARQLTQPDSHPWRTWFIETLRETLAEALLEACINSAPRHAAIDTLLVDSEELCDGRIRMWVTEATLGGGGVVEALATHFSSEPRALFRAMEAALAPTDIELASHDLGRIVQLACDDADVRAQVDRMRRTEDHGQRDLDRGKLFGLLANHGIQVSHVLGVSLNARVLKPRTSSTTDTLLRDLLLAWDALEQSLAIAVPLREFCYTAAVNPRFTGRLEALLPVRRASNPSELVQVLASLLWARGGEIRQRALDSYNPFRRRRTTDPALVRGFLLDERAPAISVGRSDWLDATLARFGETGTVRLTCELGNESHLRKALTRLLAMPVNVGYLQFFPSIERIERDVQQFSAHLSLRERV